ncbi:MAG: cupredoxin domain-containing protein [Gemmatirosa sp.]
MRLPAPFFRRLAPSCAVSALAALFAACGGGGDDVGDGPTPPRATAAAADSLYTFPQQWSSPELRIRAGGFVDFFFEGGLPHNAIFRLNPADPALPGAPADIPITVNQVVRRTFARVGTFPVNCTLHPGMIAEIVVVP